MELRHLRYFVAAAEAENISRAALRLHVSQPALSRQIQDLEEELGFSLFERSPKSVQLTQAGKAFLLEARAVLRRADEAVSAARAIATGGRTELPVGYAPSPTVRIMPGALRAFQAQFPKVRVRLHDLSTEEMLAGIREGKLQLALLVRPNRAMLRGLTFEELARDAICLAVPPHHLLASAASVALTQAAKEPLVVFSRKDYPEYHEYLEALFATIKAKPRIAEEHDSSASLIAAIESGSGVAIVPRSFSCSAGPRLKLLPVMPAPEPLVIGAVWAKDRLTPGAEGFLKAAKAAASALKSAARSET
jgi:LysR family transcriptional regulator, benzoate and cis,cis-muconate-responsive activator of ben and cat genes